jgi:periplasmic protein CpxP/Spy
LIRSARFTLLVSAAAIFASSGLAHAQPPGQGGGPQQADLQSLLHLRPDQVGALHAMQAAGRPRPDEQSAFQAASPQALATLHAPARLDRIGAALSAEITQFRRNADATRAFYDQLSPDQQRTFDQVTAPPQRGGRPQG